MAGQEIRIMLEPVRHLDFGTISGTYMGVGTPISNAARQFFIQNLTDETLMFSFDGVNDHFPLPSEGFLLDDITSNKTSLQGFYLTEGTRLYVRELDTPPGTGSVYFTVFYGTSI
jgi:hypothetical protein